MAAAADCSVSAGAEPPDENLSVEAPSEVCWTERAAPNSMDCLPLEVLGEVAARLDVRSLLNLERVSVRCRDAVSLHLSHLKAFCVGASPHRDAVLAVLPRLTALRELLVRLSDDDDEMWLQKKAVMAAAPSWPRLQRLTLVGEDRFLETRLLTQLCTACTQLTDITLDCAVNDCGLGAVSSALPGLRSLSVLSFIHLGHPDVPPVLHRLPAGLQRLSLDCEKLSWKEIAGLARCIELRSLELLDCRKMVPHSLAVALEGLSRLERLKIVDKGDKSLAASLPHAGLGRLRRLELDDCRLATRELELLLERLPQLEALSLTRCALKPGGVALLGRLPALRCLSLVGSSAVSDWSLAALSSASLEELELGRAGAGFPAIVTAEGLLGLSRRCPGLRALTLRADDELVERVECGPTVDERRLLLRLRVWLAKMMDLAIFARRVEGWVR